MIRILVINSNKIIIETNKKIRLEKKACFRKDKYTFITPPEKIKNKFRSVPRKKLSPYYRTKWKEK